MHSVPCNECSGLVLGVTSVMHFIMTHYSDLQSMIAGTLQVSFQIDSSALASWMNPAHCHKNVFIRNSCIKINDLCLDVSKDYSLQVDFSHVAGIGNISDYNSKTSFDSDPFLLVNSSDWRHGHKEFTDPIFPAEPMIFMKYSHGKLTKYQQPKLDTNIPTNLSCCAGIIKEHDVAPTLGHFSIRNTNVDLEEMLHQLPTLPEIQYLSLLQRKTLIQAVRLLARVLSAVLPQPLLLRLKLPENFRQISRQDVSKHKGSLNQFLPKEASSVMTKLAFLTLVKSSNAIFLPKKALMAGGVAIHKTRYSIETMTKIFQSKILPIVSSKDRPFLKRLFEHAHIMSQNDKRLHVGIGLSMIRSKQGICCFTVFSLYQTLLQ